MIETRIGNLLEDDKVNVIIHQCNCHHIMGGGIARKIAQIYPAAEEADRKTVKGDAQKLGTYSVASVDGKYIINLYGQFDISSGERETSYDALARGFEAIERKIRNSADPEKYILGVPYGLGSDLARGSWTIVRAILEKTFAKSPVVLHIIRLPNVPDME